MAQRWLLGGSLLLRQDGRRSVWSRTKEVLASSGGSDRSAASAAAEHGACRGAGRSVCLCPGAGRGRRPRTATKTSTGREGSCGKLRVPGSECTAERQNRLPVAAEQLRPGAVASAGRSLCFVCRLPPAPSGPSRPSPSVPRMFPETSSTMGHVAELRGNRAPASLFKGR